MSTIARVAGRPSARGLPAPQRGGRPVQGQEHNRTGYSNRAEGFRWQQAAGCVFRSLAGRVWESCWRVPRVAPCACRGSKVQPPTVAPPSHRSVAAVRPVPQRLHERPLGSPGQLALPPSPGRRAALHLVSRPGRCQTQGCAAAGRRPAPATSLSTLAFVSHHGREGGRRWRGEADPDAVLSHIDRHRGLLPGLRPTGAARAAG